jgi:ribosomal protein S18 acetylase RimI-like enzyme
VGRPPTVTDLLEAHRTFRGFAGRVHSIRGAEVLTNPRYPHLPRANCVLVGALAPPTPWSEIAAASETHLRTAGAFGRRVMLFGAEVAARLGAELMMDGFRGHALRLLSYDLGRALPETASEAVGWVDLFRMPARYALRYRIAQERRGSGVAAAEDARLYLSRSDAAWRRTAAAFVDAELAAAADLTTVGSVAEINTVETAPEFRGRGLARALLAFLVEAALRSERAGVYLVCEDGPIVEGLYVPAGFTPVATIHSFERPG